jgi:hypothetical protein
MHQILITAANEALDVNFANFAPHVQAYVIHYGLKQILNDAGASKKDASDKYDAALAKLQRMIEGEVGRVSGGGMSALDREMFRLATDFFHAKIKASPHKTVKAYKAVDGNDEKLAAAIEKRVESGVDRETAEANLAAKKAALADTPDLGDLGL